LIKRKILKHRKVKHFRNGTSIIYKSTGLKEKYNHRR